MPPIKERLVARSDRAVVAVDDPFCAAIADRLQAQGRPVTRISTSGVQLADGLVLDGTRIVQHTSGRAPDILADLAGLPNLRGRHNAQNAAAAIAAMGPVLFAGPDLRHPEPAAQQPSRRTQDLGASVDRWGGRLSMMKVLKRLDRNPLPPPSVPSPALPPHGAGRAARTGAVHQRFQGHQRRCGRARR